MKRIAAVCLSVLSLAAAAAAQTAAPARPAQPAAPAKAAAAPALSAATRQKLMAALDKGAAYLKSQQKPDGTFDPNPGITGMAATALLRQPGAHDAALKATTKT